MASSQPNSPSDSEPEAIPESPPTLPSLPDAPPSLHDAPPSLHTFPLPPLDQYYDTPEQGMAAINAFGALHGYAVTSLRSKKTKRGVKKVIYICCDRGRPVSTRARPEGAPERKRQTTTLSNNCPFAMAIRLNLETGKWSFTVEDTSHNHTPSPLSTHPIQRSLELSTVSDGIQKQLEQGLPTRQILHALRKDNPETCLNAQDIYNFRHKLHAEFLAGRTPLQALLIELPKDGEWIFKYEVDDENHVTALFCMHKTSIALLKTNSWVISMDCTYKTNRYGLPMLDIVGFTATGSTFYVGFAFIKDEKDDSYEVILSCLVEAYEALGLQAPRTILTDKE
ncbi:hypothetical protein PENARI_c015G06959 [Penicillium arizonense]|uniref:MULE transposase domain-containing protein n=1 Tax=Penicillium arizonense TaxID=1835702 RepID=A0A1F5LCL4_PENAI|nr:hypothetical protein PENARI_c015G06959 [Penicillium arizonense]OGE50952.1 hypothetical protein PENARI_c015G06959 [Penicillium arizonense]